MNSDDDQFSVSSETSSKTRSTKGSFRRRLKSIGSSADRSRHSFIDGTRTVSSRIVKKALGRRTSKEIGEIKEEVKEETLTSSSTTVGPACEIFDSIKFDFPASPSRTSACFDDIDDENSLLDEDLPPPRFPPPPLPEQFYDDVFSDRSSTSYSDSQYELLEKGKTDAASSVEGSTGKAVEGAVDIPFYRVRDNFDVRSDTLSNSFGNESEEIRSRSSGDDFIDSFNRVFANFDMKPINATDRSFDSFFSSSETGSSGNSVETRAYHHHHHHHHHHHYQHAYENWRLKDVAPEEGAVATKMASSAAIPRPSSPTKSVIIQFDPLYDAVCADDEGQDQDLLKDQDDDCDSLSDVFTSMDTQQSPDASPGYGILPAKRASIGGFTSSAEQVGGEDVASSGGKKEKRNASKSGASSVSGWSLRRALKVVSDNRWPKGSIASAPKVGSGPSLRTNCTTLGKPEMCSKFSAMLHNGYLFKSSSSTGEKTKDFTRFWCQLAEGKLFYSVEKDAAAKESIDLDTILSVYLIKDHRSNIDGEDLYCFEINVSTRVQKYVFATLCTSERCVWMQKLFQNLTLSFPARLSADYTRAGWCFLKECINGTWTCCWLMLQRRTLIYTRGNELVEIDLRKARSVGMQETDDAVLSDKTSRHVIVLDTVSRYLYLIMGKVNETMEWQRVIRSAAVNNSRDLDDQQLTKDDVPVIVDKCINFVYAHGSMSEGIYRRSGSNSSVTKLLSSFRQDSWSVHLSRQDYTEYDVASVLKRFFRDLPEPLFTMQLHKHFCNAPAIDCSEEDKLSLYRSILEQLKPINYVTVRKLIGHLHSIQLQHEKNLMTVENLAAIWGPTLMHAENNESNQWLNQECRALSDLISLFPKLFLVDKKEQERENKIREVLEKHHNSYASIPQSFKPSGDLRVWIYLKSKESGDYVNITIDPYKTCESVCQELAIRVDMQPHLLCLHEVICNESLTRPLHYKERILDSVLRWGYWDEVDRKNNYLLLSANNIIREILPLAKSPLTIYNELLFADRKMKSFKNHYFEFSGGTLCFYKDKKSSVKLKEWNIEDIIWYLGYESKRNPRCRWAITFIDKNEKQNRLKENPFFGYTMAGTNKEDRLRWVAAFAVGQYPDADLLMPVSLLK